MKPNDGTYANNALKHGVAGINIDGCRVTAPDEDPNARPNTSKNTGESSAFGGGVHDGYDFKQGRFPANIIHDGSEEVLSLFPETKSGARKGGSSANDDRIFKLHGGACSGSSGSAARFFYCAKASKKERGEGNNHPTVKPLALARYLIRLVKMPGKTIIMDNFMGSGTFGVAAKLEGVDYIGIEKGPESFKIAQTRIRLAEHQLSF